MSDLNKTTHIGTAVTNPSYINIGGTTPAIVFTLKVRENWKNKRGERQYKDNVFQVEVLGRNAFWAKENVMAGGRYHVDGYLRSDLINGAEEIRIRAFNVQEEENEEAKLALKEGLREGLTRAKALVTNSDDVKGALAKLEVLLEEC